MKDESDRFLRLILHLQPFCSSVLGEIQPWVIGAAAGDLEGEMGLITPGNVADHRGTLILSQGQETASINPLSLKLPALTLMGHLPGKAVLIHERQRDRCVLVRLSSPGPLQPSFLHLVMRRRGDRPALPAGSGLGPARKEPVVGSSRSAGSTAPTGCPWAGVRPPALTGGGPRRCSLASDNGTPGPAVPKRTAGYY